MNKLLTLATLGLALSFGAAHAASDCETKAADKKLAGAAKTSFVKKCEKDSKPAVSAICEQSAKDKKLAGAAKTSHLKKCMADGAPMASADAKAAPASAAKPAAAAAPAASAKK